MQIFFQKLKLHALHTISNNRNMNISGLSGHIKRVNVYKLRIAQVRIQRTWSLAVLTGWPQHNFIERKYLGVLPKQKKVAVN